MLNKFRRKLLCAAFLCCRAENKRVDLRKCGAAGKKKGADVEGGGEELCCIMLESRLEKQAVDKKSTPPQT